MDPNTHQNHFGISRFVLTYTRNSKTTDCMWMFYISNDCSISQMSIFCLRAGFEIQMASYVSKQSSQSVSAKPFLYAYRVLSRDAHIIREFLWE